MKPERLRLLVSSSLLAMLALACATFAIPTPTPTLIPPTATASPTPMPDYEAMIEDGWAALDNDDVETAAEIVEEVLAQDQSLANAWALSGAVHQANQEYDEAIEDLERALAIDEDNARAHEMLIDVYQFRISVLITLLNNTYDPDAIVEAIREIRKTVDDLKDLGDESDTTQLFDMLFNSDPDYGLDQNIPEEAHDLFERAEEFFRNDQYDQAIVEYAKAIEIYPEFAVAHLYLGDTYYVQGDYEQAIEYMQRSVEINPRLVQGYSFMGDAYTNLGLAEHARDAFLAALYLDIDNEIAYNGLGRIHAVLGNWDKAYFLPYEFVFYFDPELDTEAFTNEDFGEPSADQGAVRIIAPDSLAVVSWQPWEGSAVTLETGGKFFEVLFGLVGIMPIGDLTEFGYSNTPMVIQVYEYDSPNDDIERNGVLAVATCDVRIFTLQFEYEETALDDVLVQSAPYFESFRCEAQ